MIKSILENSLAIHRKLLDDIDLQSIVQTISEACIQSIKEGKKVILCGNGGSFADAQHIAAEFTGRFMKDRDSLPALTLGCNLSTTTSIGNDFSFDDIFSRELSSIGQPGDVLIGITTSGNSQNILNAIDIAKQNDIQPFGFTGNKKGTITKRCPCVEIPSNSTPRIQECHILIGHIICEMVEASY